MIQWKNQKINLSTGKKGIRDLITLKPDYQIINWSNVQSIKEFVNNQKNLYYNQNIIFV